MPKYSAGIDFGTSNSSAAIATRDGPVLVALEQSHFTIPTALYFTDDGGVFFGRDAASRYTDGVSAGRFMHSIKRILGTSLMDSSGTIIGRRMIRFDKIIETFIRHIKEKIDAAVCASVENIVMGRPVHFRDNDPAGDAAAEKQLRAIAIAAGFKNVAFQFEPIAAAFAHERHLTSVKLAIVIDIGGGTSDFSVIRLSPAHRDLVDRSQDILANTGVRVGGNDFDRDLSLFAFMPEFGMGTQIGGDKVLPMPTAPFFTLSTWNEVNDLYAYKSLNQIRKWHFQSRAPEKLRRLIEVAENNLGHKNLGYVEDAKIKLSANSEVKMTLDFLSDRPIVLITRGEFDAAIERNIAKIRESMDECLRQSGVRAADIDLAIMTGGSTEVPRISELAADYFPNAEISASDKLSSVGLGLAFDSMRRF